MNGKQNEVKKSEAALREEEVIAFWNDEAIFEKTVEKDAPEGEFVFYDGPPFATGLPHMGHLLISSYKDAIGRYKTMRGYTVPRRWGWDCHGLPIENIVEKKLNLKTKKDIEELGVARFNEEAKNSVLTYVSDWKHYIERIGRWVDFDNSYKTMDNTYIESVWWALKKIHSDGRLYEGRKVLMYCPHCETPLSKAEIAMDNSYKDVTDESVFVRFKLAEKGKIGKTKVDDATYVLAWTTTPWTLPGNVALAVGPNVTYVLVKHGKEKLLLAKERLKILSGKHTVIEEVQGEKLADLTYEPLYEVPKAEGQKSKRAWSVVTADFVTTEDGTGVVHIAPMYGEDDYNLGLEYELPVVPLLNESGNFNDDAPELVRGMYFKKGGRYVTEDLEQRDLILTKHPHTHSYPHCYRCGTALIYNALTSWFINIQAVKQYLLESNEEVTWYPEHLKHGRFKHTIETAPDWTISRNRYWASPLPIWRNAATDALHIIGSLDDLRARTKKSGNTYYMTRHGEAESNVKKIISTLPEHKNHLTKKGRTQVEELAKKLKKEGITRIITSPLMRTRETADLIAKALEIPTDDILVDTRLQEWQLTELHTKKVKELHAVCPGVRERFEKECAPGAETLVDMKRRIGEALYEYEDTYQNEKILIVGHEYTLWLAQSVAAGADVDQCVVIRGEDEDFVDNGQVQELEFVPLPHNGEYELDLHRPYIDELPLVSDDGEVLTRVPEVVDCWVESGAMPFASEHYPHENKDVVKRRYPGDFIAEYIAQTRTWFYYMHALGVLLFDAPSYKNCISTGTVLASDGSKMSKSKGNFTDPLENIDRYGADALRFYLLGSVVMAGEDLAFNDDEIREAHNRFLNMLWNSYKFYELHQSRYDPEEKIKRTVLDTWILARLEEVVSDVTTSMDSYDTIKSARALREFVSDFSTWYVRRSRDRFKSESEEDAQAALHTTREVLLTLARLIAPITPFIAESLYRGIGGKKESVHLARWPRATGDSDKSLTEAMAEVRRVASLVLEARQREGIKVRQPLAKVTLTTDTLEGKEELLALLVDEVNVKEVVFGSGLPEEITLDTELTDTLVREGYVRELTRSVQAMRKDAGLKPDDTVTLMVDSDDTGKQLVALAHDDLRRVAGVKKIAHEKGKETRTLTLGTTTLELSLQGM